MKSVIIPLIN